MSREYITGGYSHMLQYPSATYVSHDEIRDFIVSVSYVAAPPAAGGGVNVTVDGQSVTASVGTVTVSGAAKVDVTGQSVTASVGTVTIVGKAVVDLTGLSVTANVGTVTISAGGAVSVSVTGQSMTASVGDVTIVGKANVVATGQSMTLENGVVTVNTGSGAVDVTVAVTGQSMTASVNWVSPRTGPGKPIGVQLLVSLGSITNPFVTSSGYAMVEVGDLVYVVVTEQNTKTVTAVSDNLGNTYWDMNGGSDVGTATGRSFASLVDVPGGLTAISATCTPSGNNAIMVASAFQGPFTGTDANPFNVGTDIVSPYDGPATGTLAQAQELLVAWCTRPDGFAIFAVSPLISIGTFASASVIRTNLSYQVLSSTASVQPSWTSTSDPAQFLSGASTFMFDTGAVDVDVPTTGSPLTLTMGDVTVSVIANPVVDVTGQAMTAAVGTATVRGDAQVLAAKATMSAAVGVPTVNVTARVDVSVTGTTVVASVGQAVVAASARVDVLGLQAAVNVGTVTVIGGFKVTANVSGQFVTAMVGTTTVRINSTVNVQGTVMSITVGDAQSLIGVGGVQVWTGSTYTRKPVKIWNGSTWVQKSVKHWNGSTWV